MFLLISSHIRLEKWRKDMEDPINELVVPFLNTFSKRCVSSQKENILLFWPALSVGIALCFRALGKQVLYMMRRIEVVHIWYEKKSYAAWPHIFLRSSFFIPRKIIVHPYAKNCIVFYHIFKTKCWYCIIIDKNNLIHWWW